jgi:hypothetical protein
LHSLTTNPNSSYLVSVITNVGSRVGGGRVGSGVKEGIGVIVGVIVGVEVATGSIEYTSSVNGSKELLDVEQEVRRKAARRSRMLIFSMITT